MNFITCQEQPIVWATANQVCRWISHLQSLRFAPTDA